MPRELQGITARQAIAALHRAGFRVLRRKGRHTLLARAGAPRLVVPVHSRPLKTGLLKQEIKKAGLTLEEFQALL